MSAALLPCLVVAITNGDTIAGMGLGLHALCAPADSQLFAIDTNQACPSEEVNCAIAQATSHHNIASERKTCNGIVRYERDITMQCLDIPESNSAIVGGRDQPAVWQLRYRIYPLCMTFQQNWFTSQFDVPYSEYPVVSSPDYSAVV